MVTIALWALQLYWREAWIFHLVVLYVNALKVHLRENKSSDYIWTALEEYNSQNSCYEAERFILYIVFAFWNSTPTFSFSVHWFGGRALCQNRNPPSWTTSDQPIHIKFCDRKVGWILHVYAFCSVQVCCLSEVIPAYKQYCIYKVVVYA